MEGRIGTEIQQIYKCVYMNNKDKNFMQTFKKLAH